MLPQQLCRPTGGSQVGESGTERTNMRRYLVSEGERGQPNSVDPGAQSQRTKNDTSKAASAQGGTEQCYKPEGPSKQVDLGEIYTTVTSVGGHNYRGARVPVPSGLCIQAWRKYLEGYHDTTLPDFLEFGWPVNCDLTAMITPTYRNHPSALRFQEDIDFYIATEVSFGALGGPYDRPPFTYLHTSPLMTRPKKDSVHRRVIMDLSWPPMTSINDAIRGESYVDGLMRIRLPTIEYMEGRILDLGRGAYLYKTDLARGYRQLRVDPSDWPLLGFMNGNDFYFDLCPPFGLRTSALCMQRTAEAISWVHGQRGFVSRPYLDDFGGAEASRGRAETALQTLQDVMSELGVCEAKHKICRPSQRMIWLGLWYDTIAMTVSIPEAKLSEIMQVLREWESKKRASQREMQQLLGLLQFVASVSPATRIFTNRMLANLREMPKQGTESLSLGFKSDLRFFLELLPDYNGIRIMDKSQVACQDKLELDACLTGCGAYTGNFYYAEEFPVSVQKEGHTIAHLELLNVVVALKVWCKHWKGQRVHVKCDNMNACLAVQTGRSRDPFIQHCVRELFVWSVSFDIELRLVHCPGKEMDRADALSRMHKEKRCREWVQRDKCLRAARRLRVYERVFELVSVV